MRHRETRGRRKGQFRGQASCILDSEGHFLTVSPSLASFLHADGRTLRGRTLYSCMDKGAAEQVAPLVALTAAGQRNDTFQILMQRPGGPAWVVMHLMAGGVGPDGEALVAAFFENP